MEFSPSQGGGFFGTLKRTHKITFIQVGGYFDMCTKSLHWRCCNDV